MFPHLPLLSPIILVETTMASFSNLHQLNKILKVVLWLLLFYDREFDLLHLLNRMRVLLEEVMDYRFGFIDGTARIVTPTG